MKKRRTRRQIPKNDYIEKLKILYPKCKKDENSQNEKYTEHKITYGEMNYEGIELLYKHLIKHYFDILPHCFLDVGSGRGKLCLYMAEKSNIDRSVGIELVEIRYQDALELQEKLHYPMYTNKVNFYNSNIFNISLNKIIIASPVMVWFSNLCFDPNTTDKIFQKLVNELPNQSIICSSKPPNIVIDKCEYKDSILVPMSWIENSSVYIYQINI
jgi:hypothetical protein